MDSSSKYDATSKWVATAGGSSRVPEDDAIAPVDAVIIIHSEPEANLAFSWKKLMLHMGPGFLMCIAYIDPGNLEADLQTGASTGYSLLWVLLLATACGYLLQSLSAKLGVATGKHLAQHCRDRYPESLRYVLWLMAELAIIGSDIQEVVGTSIAVKLLTRGTIPLWGGVIVAASSAYVFLFLEKAGIRWLEAFFQVLVGIMAGTFGLLFFKADVPYGEVVRGFLVPRLNAAALPTAAALIGSILMPHNIFLHSALVHNRAMPAFAQTAPLKETLRYYNLDTAAALAVTLLINTSVISVFARGFYGTKSLDDIGLENAGQYLGSRFGRQMELIWAVGLLAAGQSSTMTGTYAGQYVMSGYLNLKLKPFAVAVLTRGVAVGPTLLVAFYARSDSTRLDIFNQWLNILQAVQLPFAVVPLLALTSDKAVMGIGFANNKKTALLAWVVAAAIMAVNCGTAYQLLSHKFAENAVLYAVFIIAVLGYMSLVGYLLLETYWRRNESATAVAAAGQGGEDGGGEDGESIVAPLLFIPEQSLSATVDIPDSARSRLSSHHIEDIIETPST